MRGQGDHVVIIGNAEASGSTGNRGMVWIRTGPNRHSESEKKQKIGSATDGRQKVCIVSQTTFNYKKFQDLVEIICKKGL